MAGFSGATGVPKKYVDDAIAQSTATLTKRFNMTSSGTDRNAVLHAWMNTIHSQLTLGEEACLTGIFQSTMYFGLISKVTNSVIMGRMFTPNSDSGFYFRDGINDNTATSSDIQSTANFGKWEAISSFPFTAPENGYIYLYLNPSSASGANARYTYTNNGLNMQITLTAPDGNGVAAYAPINKYASLSQAALNNGSVAGRFMQA